MAGPDHAAHRAPPVHPAAGRPDRGAGRGPAGRPGHARGADRALPAVPAAAGRAPATTPRASTPASCRLLSSTMAAQDRCRLPGPAGPGADHPEPVAGPGRRGRRPGLVRPRPAAQLAAAAAAGIGRGSLSAGLAGARAAGRGGSGAGARPRAAGWPASRPSPELLAKVDALPPANDTPDVDESFARAPDPHFTLRRLLRPFAIALIIGLVLDGLDALASMVMPLLVRGGIDNGVERHLLSFQARFQTIALVSAIGLGIVLADWVHQLGPDHRGRPQRRAAAVHAAGEDLRPAAAARPRLLRARADRPDHDPDDHGRGRPVLVPADRPDHHGQLGADVRRWCWSCCCSSTSAWAWPWSRSCRSWSWPRSCSGRSPRGPTPRPGRRSAWSTPTCRRTWPGCGWPRPTGASRSTRTGSPG